MNTTPTIEQRIPQFKVLFWIGVLLFIINDLWWMLIRSGVLFYLLDYVFRIVLIMAFYLFMRSKKNTSPSIIDLLFLRFSSARKSQPTWKSLLPWIAVVSVLGIVIDQTVWPYLAYRVPNITMFNVPSLRGPLKIIDLTLGVSLVALTEEIVFRSLAWRALIPGRLKETPATTKVEDSYQQSGGMPVGRVSWYVIVLGCCLFGLAHWSMGLHAIISTALWGVLPMLALMRTGSLWPALIAHFATDVVAFSGIIPEAYYKWMMPCL